jgi:putative glutathione S-transferase
MKPTRNRERRSTKHKNTKEKEKKRKKEIFIQINVYQYTESFLFLQVYSVYFKCNKKLIREYPNLFNYTKDIYQIPGISSTVNMEYIRKSYYGGYSPINPYGIIPVGPNIDYSAPHDREKFNA